MLNVALANAQLPKKAVAAFNQAMVLAGQGKHADALGFFKKATELYPGYYEAFVQAGISFSKLSLHADAKYCFNKAIRLKPNYCPAQIEFGNYYKDVRGKRDSAMIYYNNAQKYNCDTSALLNFNLGWCYNDMGQYDKAMAMLKKAIAIDPLYKIAITEISFTFRKLEQRAEGITYYQGQYDSTKLDIYMYWVGFFNIDLKQKDKAIAAYEELKAIGSKLAPALDKRIKAMPE